MAKKYSEKPLVKTKIIATIGPACQRKEQLKELVEAGVDLFRLNFAHGQHEWLTGILKTIHEISKELDKPIGTLGDLSGPKIRLGELPDTGIHCLEGERYEFIRGTTTQNTHQLTCTYESLIDDVEVDDRILLADGSVEMVVVDKTNDSITCEVHRPGLIRSRQGVNLPGATLSTASLTEKDREDLAWALEHEIDYVGLSFVRSADDIRLLRKMIEEHPGEHKPGIVAKIEKMEAINDLEAILRETDAVMVARGDLGVEVDITRVPTLQKRIISRCNAYRIPVITATQMLDSMQQNQMPTRAEASDVANAVLDGSDAVMLSGETAAGKFPVDAVTMMSRIVNEAERMVQSNRYTERDTSPRTRALIVTEASTIAAHAAGEFLDADLIVVATHSGRTAMAVSRQRSKVPILAVTDREETSRRMCLYWGVTPLLTEAVHESSEALLRFVIDWGKKASVLQSGSRVVLVGTTNWSSEGHNLLLVHVIP